MPQQTHRPWINDLRRALCQLRFCETFVMLGHGSKLHFMKHMRWFSQWIGWIIYNMNYQPGLWCPVLNSWSFFVPFLISCTCLPLQPCHARLSILLADCSVVAAVLVATWDDSSHSPWVRFILPQKSPVINFPFFCLAHWYYNICYWHINFQLKPINTGAVHIF